ncbi:MAG TPA: hypothetical protein VHR66_06995 [Gemmataceae bacterium]|jgi:hypothetical protein|nr:hypothetical protein [Gemmataceae bacterium]
MFRRALQHVPVLVWLLLAASQFVLLPYVIRLNSMSDSELYANEREDAYVRLAAMAAFVPLFLGLSVWRWWVGPPREQLVQR